MSAAAAAATPIAALDTPVLLVDGAAPERNIARMEALAAAGSKTQ